MTQPALFLTICDDCAGTTRIPETAVIEGHIYQTGYSNPCPHCTEGGAREYDPDLAEVPF